MAQVGALHAQRLLLLHPQQAAVKQLAPALRAPGEPSANSLGDKKLIPLHYDFRGARRGLGLCFQLALCLGTLLP